MKAEFNVVQSHVQLPARGPKKALGEKAQEALEQFDAYADTLRNLDEQMADRSQKLPGVVSASSFQKGQGLDGHLQFNPHDRKAKGVDGVDSMDVTERQRKLTYERDGDKERFTISELTFDVQGQQVRQVLEMNRSNGTLAVFEHDLPGWHS